MTLKKGKTQEEKEERPEVMGRAWNEMMAGMWGKGKERKKGRKRREGQGWKEGRNVREGQRKEERQE